MTIAPKHLRAFARVTGKIVSSASMIDTHTKQLVERLAQKGWDVELEPLPVDESRGSPSGEATFLGGPSPFFSFAVFMHRAQRPANETEPEDEARAALYVALAELHLGNRSLDFVAENLVTRLFGALARRKP